MYYTVKRTFNFKDRGVANIITVDPIPQFIPDSVASLPAFEDALKNGDIIKFEAPTVVYEEQTPDVVTITEPEESEPAVVTEEPKKGFKGKK